MTEKYKKPRKEIKAKINRYLGEDIDKLADLEFEDRPTKYEKEDPVKMKKKEKVLRYKEIEKRKLRKFWIRNRKRIQKRAEVESEILYEE